MFTKFRLKKFSILSIIIISAVIIIFILNNLQLSYLRLLPTNFYPSHEPVDRDLHFLPQKFDSKPSNAVVENNLTYNHNETINSLNNLAVNETRLLTNINETSNTIAPLKKLTYRVTSERLWFLTNGTLRPDPVLSEKLAVWPNEGDPEDDRVINQLMYLPSGYSQQTSKLKTIYLNKNDFDWNLSLGKEVFSKCPVNSCALVDRSLAPSADLIFFKNHFYDFNDEFKRPPNQIWLLFELESPLNTGSIRMANNHINWTASYRHDSEVATPYFKYFPYSNENSLSDNETTINYAQGKTKKVAWFVSNCNARNKRLEYALQLKNYIQVDIYGECGDLRCSRLNSEDCFQILERDYKFYLAFENSNCLDYITEKFWINGLMHNVIPIVMGAHPSTYKRFAPPSSFIHVDNFESPKQLANYLNLLDKNDKLYNKYFRWKGNGEIRGIEMWCRVCALLHDNNYKKVYQNIDHWWSNESICVDTSWTNKDLYFDTAGKLN